MLATYERLRDENVKRNREVLLALGLGGLGARMLPRTTREAVPAAKTRKRKLPPPQDTEDEDEPDAKVSKKHAAQNIASTSGVQRRARSARKVTACENTVDGTLPEVASTSAKIVTNSEGTSMSEHRHSPYVNPLVLCHAIANHQLSLWK